MMTKTNWQDEFGGYLDKLFGEEQMEYNQGIKNGLEAFISQLLQDQLNEVVDGLNNITNLRLMPTSEADKAWNDVIDLVDQLKQKLEK
jgi:hypothetical protein